MKVRAKPAVRDSGRLVPAQHLPWWGGAVLPETDQGCIGPGSHRRCLRLPTGSYKHGHAPAKAPARQEKTAAALERGGARAPRASSRVRFRSQAPIAPDRCPLGAQVRRRSSAPRHPVRLRAPAAAVRRHVAARSRALRTSGSRRGRAHARACAPGGAGREDFPKGRGCGGGPGGRRAPCGPVAGGRRRV